jgi:hypothetical protein
MQQQQRQHRQLQQQQRQQQHHRCSQLQRHCCRSVLRRRRLTALRQRRQLAPRRLPSKLLLLSAGLAGVGKSTVLRALCNRLGGSCVYLDKDAINQALLGDQPYFSEYYKLHVQQQTYAVMFGIAADNLAARQRCDAAGWSVW